jgi:hypothetical protein
MTFFYDLNKRLNGIRELPETTHQQLNESKPDFLDLDKDGDKKEPMKKAAKEKPDYKAKMQDKFGGSAADLTRGLSIKSKKVDEGNYSKDAMELNPDFAKVGKKPGVMDKIAKGVKKVADFVAPGDEDLMRDLERKSGGRRPAKEAAAPMSAKQKSFAALAEPKDKITFADKIAGAKKEVDEMLGDVAAEAMKAALGKGKQPVRGMGEATKEIPGGRRHTAGPGGYGRKDDEDAPKVQTQRGRGRPKKNADSETGEVMKPDWSAFGVGKVNLPKHKGAVTKHKMVGEAFSQAAAQQIYDELADIRAVAKQAMSQRSELPQGFASRLETSIWSAMQLIQSLQPSGQLREESDPKTWTTIEDVEFVEDLMDRAFDAGSNSLGNTLQGVLEKIKYNQDDEEQMNEKAVSKKQQRFMGMVHAAKKGEKPASKEVAKAAKGISGKEASKFASTKHKGLPEKAKEDTDTRDTKAEKAGKKVTKDIEYDEKAKDGDHGKKRGPQDAKAEKAGKKVAKDIEHDEKVDETTVSGSVATAPAGSGKKSAGGFSFGQGVYEAKINEGYNRRLTALLNEEMNVNMSDSTNGNKSLTVTATDEDAVALGDMLKMAGLFSSGGYSRVDTGHDDSCSECGRHGGVHEATCGHRDMVEEELANSADNTQYADTDTMVNQLSGGLNGRKLQVNPNNPGDNPLAMGDLGRSAHSLNLGRTDEEFDRMMEMAGVKKEVDEEKTDEGNRFTGNLAKARAAGKKEADLDGDGDMEKVQESNLMQRLWKSYKG